MEYLEAFNNQITGSPCSFEMLESFYVKIVVKFPLEAPFRGQNGAAKSRF